jgi:hypothetical protein
LIDLLQIVTSTQGEAIFTKLRNANVLAVNLLIVESFDTVARERVAQSRGQINHRAAGVSYFNEVPTE